MQKEQPAGKNEAGFSRKNTKLVGGMAWCDRVDDPDQILGFR